MRNRIPSRCERVAALGLAVLLGLGAAGAQAAPDAGTYQIGFIAEKTGPAAAAGLTFFRGAELAVEEINKTGYLGRGVSLAMTDREGATDTTRSIQALSQFVADRRILAVSCCLVSPLVNVLKPVAKTGNMPMVIYGATASGLAEMPYIYNASDVAGLRDVFMAKTLSAELKPATVAYFVMGENETLVGRMKAAQAVMEQGGAKTVGVISVFGTDTDFTAAATQAMALKADMIQIYTIQTPAAGIIAALRQRGYDGHIAAIDSIASMAVFKKLGPAVVGIPFPTNFSPDILSNDASRTFAASYAAKYGDKPDSYAAQGYTAIYFIGQGLRATDGKPTREALAEAMSRMTSLDQNLYGGLPISGGQTLLTKPILAAWSADGRIVEWKPLTRTP